jgi:hypothetical protein
MASSYIRLTRDTTSNTSACSSASLLSRSECRSGCERKQIPTGTTVPGYMTNL